MLTIFTLFGVIYMNLFKIKFYEKIKVKETIKNKNDKIEDQLVCMVLTTEQNILTRGVAVYETWVSSFTKFIFELKTGESKKRK
jgi:hypothetical protein